MRVPPCNMGGAYAVPGNVACYQTAGCKGRPNLGENPYRWARLRATSNEDKSLDVDPEAITQHVKEIEASLRRMATVTTQCKAISASAEKIESVMREEERKIKDRIGDITHSMSRLGT